MIPFRGCMWNKEVTDDIKKYDKATEKCCKMERWKGELKFWILDWYGKVDNVDKSLTSQLNHGQQHF